MPRVSVVLPSYNYARYLPERVRSILQQDFRDFELIAIDDASTDDSVTILRAFEADERLKITVRDENSGRLYASWNQGLAAASGEFVLFAGADDSAERGLLRRLVDALDRHPGAAFAHTNFYLIDAAGTTNHVGIMPVGIDGIDVNSLYADLRRDYYAPPGVDWRRLMLFNFIYNASGVLFRRERLAAIGGFDAALPIAADWLAYLALARESGVAYVAEPLNAFRRLEASATNARKRAGLMAEIYHCLEAQRPFLRDDRDRAAFETGLRIAATQAGHFRWLALNAGDTVMAAELEQMAADHAPSQFARS